MHMHHSIILRKWSLQILLLVRQKLNIIVGIVLKCALVIDDQKCLLFCQYLNYGYLCGWYTGSRACQVLEANPLEEGGWQVQLVVESWQTDVDSELMEMESWGTVEFSLERGVLSDLIEIELLDAELWTLLTLVETEDTEVAR